MKSEILRPISLKFISLVYTNFREIGAISFLLGRLWIIIVFWTLELRLDANRTGDRWETRRRLKPNRIPCPCHEIQLTRRSWTRPQSWNSPRLSEPFVSNSIARFQKSSRTSPDLASSIRQLYDTAQMDTIQSSRKRCNTVQKNLAMIQPR